MAKKQISCNFLAKAAMGLVSVALCASLAGSANAQVITDTTGQFSWGVSNDANGYDFNSGTGFMRNADGYDPVSPGVPRSYWSITGGGVTGYVDPAFFGTSNVTNAAVVGANSASVASSVGGGAINVHQNISFVRANVIEITTTVTNNTGAANSFTFERGADFDVAPTETNEITHITPLIGNVADASFYGFEDPNPNTPFSDSSGPGGGTQGPGDLGAGFKLNLGMLAQGQSFTFNIFEGLSLTGQTPNGLDNELRGLGASFLTTTYSSDGGTNSVAFGVAAVPEPSQAAVLGIGIFGLALLGFAARKRRPLRA